MVPIFVHRANAYRRHAQQDSNVVSNRRYRTKAVLNVYVAQLEIRIHLVLTRVHSRQRSTGLSCNSPLAMPSLPCAHQYILALHVDGSRMKKSSSPTSPPSVHRPPSSPLHVVRPLRPECPAECPASSLLPTSRCMLVQLVFRFTSITVYSVSLTNIYVSYKASGMDGGSIVCTPASFDKGRAASLLRS